MNIFDQLKALAPQFTTVSLNMHDDQTWAARVVKKVGLSELTIRSKFGHATPEEAVEDLYKQIVATLPAQEPRHEGRERLPALSRR